jgi:beta-lactamase regulating signal transducer with metallopeptidase domain
MTVPYSVRLFCLCMAAFFLVHLAVGLAVSRLAPAAIRLARQMRAGRAAGFLLAFRMLPLATALVAVAGFCAPSYLWLEPPATVEEVGWGCLVAAAFGAVICAAAAGRAVHAVWSLNRCEQGWRRTARQEVVAGTPVVVLEGSAPFMALAGIFRARLVISRSVLDALTPAELLTAIRHERAHQASCDNLKRLVLLLAPGLFPAWPGLQAIERAWARFAEWAADDRASAGDPDCAVSLAAALVRVARLGAAPVPSLLMTSLLADSRDLSDRVDRLLGAAPAPSFCRAWAVSVPLLTVVAMAGVALLTCQPAALYWVHGTLERLAH